MTKQQKEMRDYLSLAYRADQRIQDKLEQLASLNELATKATVVLSDSPKSATRNTHKLEDAVLSIIELRDEISVDVRELIKTKTDIFHKIKAVENPEYQTLLEKRYLRFERWEQIAVDMGHNSRWVYRQHCKALEKIFEMCH